MISVFHVLIGNIILSFLGLPFVKIDLSFLVACSTFLVMFIYCSVCSTFTLPVCYKFLISVSFVKYYLQFFYCNLFFAATLSSKTQYFLTLFLRYHAISSSDRLFVFIFKVIQQWLHVFCKTFVSYLNSCLILFLVSYYLKV